MKMDYSRDPRLPFLSVIVCGLHKTLCAREKMTMAEILITVFNELAYEPAVRLSPTTMSSPGVQRISTVADRRRASAILTADKAYAVADRS